MKEMMTNKNTAKQHDVFNHLHIVLCMQTYNPLGIIRSLGEAGIRPIAITLPGVKKFVGSSKYVAREIHVPDLNSAIEALFREYGGLPAKPFLYITDDHFLEYIDQHYDDFKDKFIFANAGKQGRISYYMNKDHINQLASECGIKVPKSVVVPKGVLPEGLSYPIITKAISSTSGAWKKDSFICNSKEELIAAYKEIKGETMLIQEYIDKSAEFNIDAISVNHGEDVFLSMVTKYVYLIPGRYSTYMDVLNVDDLNLGNKMKEMIKKMGYEGIFDGEFMIGKDNEIYFLEVNLRPNAFNYASTCAGMNDPFLWAEGMLQGYIRKNSRVEIPKGFRAMVENSDFRDRVKRQKYSIIKWMYEFVTCKCHFFFNIRDMKPFINACVLKKRS